MITTQIFQIAWHCFENHTDSSDYKFENQSEILQRLMYGRWQEKLWNPAPTLREHSLITSSLGVGGWSEEMMTRWWFSREGVGGWSGRMMTVINIPPKAGNFWDFGSYHSKKSLESINNQLRRVHWWVICCEFMMMKMPPGGRRKNPGSLLLVRG